MKKLADRRGVRCERQRLHGMGEALHAAATAKHFDMPLRVYAPVGSHEDLLPYLVRRLLENGANTSFVHAFLDEEVAPETVAGDPIAALRALPRPHPRIAKPRDILLPERRSAAGVDLSIAAERARAHRRGRRTGSPRPARRAGGRDAADIDRAFAAAQRGAAGVGRRPAAWRAGGCCARWPTRSRRRCRGWSRC